MDRDDSRIVVRTDTSEIEANIVLTLRAAGCVFAEEEARLLVDEAASPTVLRKMVERRVAGEPLEVIVGWAEFCGLRIFVDPGVFVPRQRSRFLVELAVPITRPGSLVVDLCCGTGALGAAVLDRVEGVEVYAADLDPATVACARRNLGARGQVFEGDLYAALPNTLRARVDVLLANAPYVPTDSIALMPPEARLFEPHAALDGGPDGVDMHRRVAAEATSWLAPGGHLLIETSDDQADLTAAAMLDGGLLPRVAHSDEYDATVVIGVRARDTPTKPRL